MCKLSNSVFVIYLISIGVTHALKDNIAITIDHNTTRIRRQAACDGFRCRSGDCINEDEECDGVADCKDGSDETTSCQKINCPAFLFRCKYGACVNSEYECDGKQDCRDNSDETSPRCKRETATSKCTDEEFQCASGQCIPEDFKCDGTPQCSDNSDETRSTCSSIQCPGYTYRCAYGACVNGNSKCNGIKECFDGSDEDSKICKTPATPKPTRKPATPPPPPPNPLAPEGSCVLPGHPPNGNWAIFGPNGNSYRPGMSVTSGSVLQTFCNKNYKLDGQLTVLCINGGWNARIAQCLAVCPPIYSTKTMKVTCSYKNQETENCTEAFSGTFAKFRCDDFYEISRALRVENRYCVDGTWDKAKPSCEPVCGVKSVNAQTLIVNGLDAVKGDYPWQVAIYTIKNKNLICGGSLINQRVVLTAAHCVTTIKGVLKPKDLYNVAVGKYYRNYDDPRDVEAQFSAVKDLFIPEEYKGENQNFLGDIAIMVTEITFHISKRVQPACIDWALNHEEQFADPTIKGYVTGWGHTKESSTPSETLKEIKVPYIDYKQCSENLPVDYENFLTHDKLCAGYLNQSASVCSGDSGGGLVFKNRFDGRYYVTGIVSLSPLAPTEEGGCNSQQYGLYTKVSKYIMQFIYPKVNRYN